MTQHEQAATQPRVGEQGDDALWVRRDTLLQIHAPADDQTVPQPRIALGPLLRETAPPAVSCWCGEKHPVTDQSEGAVSRDYAHSHCPRIDWPQARQHFMAGLRTERARGEAERRRLQAHLDTALAECASADTTINSLETQIAELKARLVSAPPQPQDHSSAPSENSPVSGRGWRTVTHLSAAGTDSKEYDCCPDCWPSHPEEAHAYKRIAISKPWQIMLTCHWCGARRTA